MYVCIDILYYNYKCTDKAVSRTVEKCLDDVVDTGTAKHGRASVRLASDGSEACGEKAGFSSSVTIYVMFPHHIKHLTIRKTSKQQETCREYEESLVNGSRQEHNNSHPIMYNNKMRSINLYQSFLVLLQQQTSVLSFAKLGPSLTQYRARHASKSSQTGQQRNRYQDILQIKVNGE
jgi:hypothetical protein